MDPPREGPPDPNVFQRIVEEFADRVYSLALRITGSAEDAEDVLQETFLSAYQHWASFRREAALSTWLYRIAVNNALMHVRRRRPIAYLEDTGYEAVDVPDWTHDITRRVELDELRAVLDRGITLLPEENRVAVVLRDVEGLTTAEAADVLGISEAALKSRLHRGRVLLRQYLAAYLHSG